jgi:hypothetical protein
MAYRLFGFFLLAGALALVPAGEAEGQIIHGVLLDATNMQPIQGGMIQLFDEESNLVAVARSGADGRYQIQVPGAGRYRFTVTSIGYGLAGSDLIDIAERQSLEANLVIPPAPVVLEGITAEAEARPWMIEQPPVLWPYFERREFYGKLGMGAFVDREFLTLWSGPIESIPEVDFLIRTMQRRTGLIEQGCSSPAWYLDGNRVRDANINDFVGVGDLEGVEVYRRSTEIPGEFAGSDSECGVVALWTRRR